MAKIGYMSREGHRLQLVEWQKLQADPTYCNVHEYDNGAVRATLKWHGKIDLNTFPDSWKTYVLLVKNYRPDGTLVNDPVDNDQYFKDEADAVAGYQAFLAKWTECEVDAATGEFQEVDNVLVPPPPPDPNRPESMPEELGDVGAW